MSVLYAYAASAEGDSIAAALPDSLCLGWGKIRSAVNLHERLRQEPPSVCLLFGVCGIYPESGNTLAVGDLCVVSHDVVADEGVATPDGFTPLGGPIELPMSATHSKTVATMLDAPLVRGATISTCSGTDRLSQAIQARTAADVETMEGAAVAFVCQRLGVPLVQLRCVSNRTGDRHNSGWDLPGSVAVLQRAVLRVHQAGILS